MLEYFDIFNSIIQSFMVSYFPYFFLRKENLLNRKEGIIKLFLSSILIYIFVIVYTYKIQGVDLAVIIMTISNLIIIATIYKKYFKKAILGYAISYIFIQAASIFATSITWPFLSRVIGVSDIVRVIGIYIPVIIIELVVICNVSRLFEIYRHISKDKYFFEGTVLLILALDYIICLSITRHSWGETFFTNITIATLIIFIFIGMNYINTINKKCLEISTLNQRLIGKNNELKKIKHDYGSQISYLNGLYIMNQYDRLGDLFKSIISGNEEVTTYVKYMNDNNSMISNIVNSLNTGSVHIIVDEEIELNSLAISEHDLHKILSNIIKNALRALNGEGLIIIKTFKIFSTSYISIKNNGPKIEDDIIDKIFELGFTTKDNLEGNNGCGLAIVKEILAQNNSNIYVDSNDEYTEFKIVIK